MRLQFTTADVAVAVPVHKKFVYGIPEHIGNSVCIGSRVLVPFGSRKVTGYIVGLRRGAILSELKDIVNVVDETPLFPETMVTLFNWLSYYYMYPIGEVIKLALPPGLDNNIILQLQLLPKGKVALEINSISNFEKKIFTYLLKGPETVKALEAIVSEKISKSLLERMELKKWIKVNKTVKPGKICVKKVKYVSGIFSSKSTNMNTQRRKVLRHLELNGDSCLIDLICAVKTTHKLIRKMEKEGQLKVYSLSCHNDISGAAMEHKPPLKLTREQQNAVNVAGEAIGYGFKTFLLAGVTGSGKTEVYLRLAKIALNKGLSVLVLVPEIVLISQIEHNFKSHFGDYIAVLHSSLSKLELHTQWLRIIEKKATIAIGARSCVFAPLDDLGLVIVDEEHDSSYKQERAPFYNARDVAIVRAKQCNAVAVLGSATPAVQSWFNVRNGKFTEISMAHRVQKQTLPEIDVIDLSNNRNLKGVDRYFTSRLIEQMSLTLKQGQQVLLFLNRRGFATFSICSKCGKPVRCKNCDISLTLHRPSNLLVCHYCGSSKHYNSVCCFCNSSDMKPLGIGTERLEMLVKGMFPGARVARLDKDSTRKKGTIVKILNALKNREIDVLIGTQMVTKGHDFPGITLVGIICADLTMNFPDFRSSERTFQLLSQVAGRAGRGKTQGKVILQTYNPDHFAILAARKQDFKDFYRKEIEFRKVLNYPPFSRMIQLKIAGKSKSKVSSYAHTVQKLCKCTLITSNESYQDKVMVLGPIEAPLSRINKFYRWQVIIKGSDAVKLRGFVKELLRSKELKNDTSIKMFVDVDPISVM